MKSDQVWYIGERAESLVFLFFDRGAGVSITTADAERFAVDFLVNVDGGVGEPLTFGVVVKGAETVSTKWDITNLNSLGEIMVGTLPVMLIVADVKLSSLYYAWIRKPRQTQVESLQSVALRALTIHTIAELQSGERKL